MHLLRANLVLLIQRRICWLWAVILLGMGLPVFLMPFAPGPERPTFLGLAFLINALLGLVVGGVEMGLICTPLAFCLPGARRMPRAVLSFVGCAASLVLALPFAAGPWCRGWAQAPVVFAGAFAVNLAFFAAPASVAIRSRHSVGLVGFMPLVCICAAALGVHTALVDLVLSHPVAVLAPPALLSVALWRWSEPEHLMRLNCGSVHVDLANAWDVSRAQRAGRQRLLERLSARNDDGRLWKAAERACIGRMRAGVSSWRSRALLGCLYASIAPALLFPNACIGWCVAVVCSCYWRLSGSDMSAGALLFIAPIISAGQANVPIRFSPPLLPLGRTERLLASLLGSAAHGLLVCTVLLTFSAATQFLAPLMPQLRIAGHCFDFIPMDPRLIVLTAAVIPLGVLLQLLAGRPEVRLPLCGLVFAASMMVVGSPWFVTVRGWPFVLPAAAAVLWLLLALALARHCRRSDLR